MRLALPARSLCFILLAFVSALPALVAQERVVDPDAVKGDPIIERERWFYGPRQFPLGRIPAGARLKAFKRRKQMEAEEEAARQASAVSGSVIQFSAPSWTAIGPQATSSPFYGSTSGRVSALAVDPTSANIVYLGGAQGGVWKSTDGGSTWTALTDSQASLAIGALAIDPNSPNTIFAGLGEQNFSGDSYYGAGVLKSTDGGATWAQEGATVFAAPAYVGAVAVEPGNSNIVLAAAGSAGGIEFGNVQGGIYRSTDGGVTWGATPVQKAASFYDSGTSVFFDPTNGSIAYAAIKGEGVFRSTNAGATWSPLPGTGANLFPNSNLDRIELAISPSVPTTIYAAVASGNPFGELMGIWKTTDSGTNWVKLSSIGTGTATDFCGSSHQCWYDLVVRVSPVRSGGKDVIFAGGEEFTNMYQSLDGGATWSLVQNNTHPDSHALAFSADGSVLYFGNDGGVWKTTSPTTAGSSLVWTNLNGGSGGVGALGITQFYADMAVDRTGKTIFGGSQDDGTQKYTGNTVWSDTGICGDGSSAAIDFVTTSTLYVNCNSIDIEKSTSGGGTQLSYSQVINGINTGDRVKFIPPLVMDPNNSQTLYFGTFQLYQTTNGAGLWTSISPDLTTGPGFFGNISAMAVAPSNSNVVYVGTDDGNVQVTQNAGSGAAATWNLANSKLNSVTGIAVEPASASTVYVSVSGFGVGHVLRSTNATSATPTWTDISGNLPDTPVDAIVVDPNVPNTLYIGTDVGAFTTGNDNVGSPTWSTLGSGLPNVAVLALALQNSTRTLVAGTHGRSAWTLTLPGGFNLGAPSPSSVNVAATGTSTPSISFQVSANGALAGPVNLSILSGLPAGATPNFSSTSLNPTPGTPANVTLTVTTAGTTPGMYTVTIAANSTGQPQQTQTFTLHVLPDYSFTVSDPVQSTTPGTNITFHGTLTSTNGYGNSNTVTVTCAAGHPSTCNPPGTAIGPSSTGAAAPVTAGNTTTGDFTFNLNAVGNDLLAISRSQAVTLHVVNVSFTVNPGTPINVAAGSSSGPIALQVSASGSFAGSVTLSCAGASFPAGANCSFSPSATVNPTSGSPANVTMTINSGTAAAGTYNSLVVNGVVTNPSLNIASSTFTLNITSSGTQADLAASVAQAAGQPAIIPVGTKAQFTVTAVNNTAAAGAVSATVTFSVSAPNLLAAQNGCSLVGASLSCNTTLTKGSASFNQTFTTLPLPFNVRSLNATATVSSASPDPNPNNNTGTLLSPVPVGPRPISRKNLTVLPR